MPTMHKKEMRIDSRAKLLKERELRCPYLSLMMMMMMMMMMMIKIKIKIMI